MKKRAAQRAERDTGGKIIADLKRAIEARVSGSKKPEELEGIITEAKVLVKQWTIGQPSSHQRPLFDDTTNPTILLLAGLVVALTRDHRLVELIRRHRPRELENLSSESLFAEVEATAWAWASSQPKPTPKQRYEKKRRKWHRSFLKSIEYHFGGRLEAAFQEGMPLVLMSNPDALQAAVLQSQDCLDGLFAGETVNMLKLEELFGMDRHRIAEALRGFQKRRFNYLAVTKIMDFLLKEKRRKERKMSTRGRSPRKPWLDDHDLRIRVLRGIEARINSRSLPEHIRTSFLAVVRRHMPDSGKQ
jgi:hypothetical protein